MWRKKNFDICACMNKFWYEKQTQKKKKNKFMIYKFAYVLHNCYLIKFQKWKFSKFENKKK